MSKRTDIISSLISTIEADTLASGHRGLRFLHEISSFPAFYVHPTNESRVHISSGVKFGIIAISIRGYQWSDNLDDIELFARTIETSIQQFRNTHRSLVQETRVTSLSTDEGVMAPYGAVDLVVEIIYDVN